MKHRTSIPASVITVGIINFLSANSFAQSTPGPKPVDPPCSNAVLQRYYSETSPRFAAFLKRHPGTWIPTFDEETGSPLSIVGRGIVVSARPIANLNAARALAIETLKNESYLWGAPFAEFELETRIKSGKIYIFGWKQVHDGLDVIGGRVDIQIHETGRVALVGTSALEITNDPRSEIKLSADAAVAAVVKNKKLAAGDAAAAADIAIFAKRARGTVEPRPVFIVTVSQYSQHVSERVLVDAGTGEILRVESLIHDNNNVHGAVTGASLLGLSPVSGTTVTGIPDVQVSVHSNSGANVAGSADGSGNFNIQMPDAGPHTATVTLQSPNFTILNAAGANVSVNGVAASDGSGGFLVNLDANPSLSEETTAQVSAAVMHHQIRDYIVGQLPAYAAAFPLQKVWVNEASVCNAYFDTYDDAIHFFHSGSGCFNTAYSTVVYHEFGHGVDEFFGHILSAGLSEGVADTVAMYYTQQQIIGQDFFGVGSYIRNGENGVTWPATGCGYEPHCLGESYMGFTWLARKNLIQTLGQAQGKTVAETDILGSLPANSLTIPLAVQQAFIQDDNDGDLTNGTPHFNDLSAAALAKGFTLPTAVGINLIHTAHPNTAGQTLAYPIYIDTTTQAGVSIGGVHVDYSDDEGGTWHSVGASLTTTPGRYRAQIPAHIAPAVIHYRLVANNTSGVTIVVPEGDDDAYRFSVGARASVFFDNFESGGPGWTHGATAGLDDWQIGDPAGSPANQYLLDPPAAFSGTNVLGNDLGLTGGDGLYEANTSTYAASPAISGSGLSNLRLRFRRWLGSEGSQYDHAQVALTGGVSALLWENAFQPEHLDLAWTLQDMPIPAANGVSSFNIKYSEDSDPGLEYGGWTLDDVEVYNLSATPVGTFALGINSTAPPIGSTLTFTSTGNPGAYFEIYASTNTGPVAVEGFGVVDVGNDAIFFYNGNLDGAGVHSISFELPNNPIFIGFEINAVGFEVVPGGTEPQLGNAVRLIIS
ncbi:MAG: hypothetical protein HY286_18080 [Planctomycetes bacterium]|nr:hypothetical protein [Planctomycetota bacterium]